MVPPSASSRRSPTITRASTATSAAPRPMTGDGAHERHEGDALDRREPAWTGEQPWSGTFVEHGLDVLVVQGCQSHGDVLPHLGQHAPRAECHDGPEVLVAARAEQELDAGPDALLHEHAAGARARVQCLAGRADFVGITYVEDDAADVGLVGKSRRVGFHDDGIAERRRGGHGVVHRFDGALPTEPNAVRFEESPRLAVRQRATRAPERGAEVLRQLHRARRAARRARTRLPESAPRANRTLGA